LFFGKKACPKRNLVVNVEKKVLLWPSHEIPPVCRFVRTKTATTINAGAKEKKKGFSQLSKKKKKKKNLQWREGKPRKFRPPPVRKKDLKYGLPKRKGDVPSGEKKGSNDTT